MISNSGLQMHHQVVFGYAPSGKAAWTRSVPISGRFHISFCYPSGFLFGLPTPDLLFVNLGPVFQRLSDECTVNFGEKATRI